MEGVVVPLEDRDHINEPLTGRTVVTRRSQS